MKKYIYISFLSLALWALATPVAAEDCSVLMGAAKILYQQQKWDIVKMECETYLSQCGYNAEVQQMLDECNAHLLGAQETPAPAPAPQPQPQPKPQPAYSTPAPAPAPTPAGDGFALELVEEDDSAPAPTYTPEPAPAPTPEPVFTPEPEPIYTSEPEPASVFTPAPEPEPEPDILIAPEPEPEPVHVYVAEPEPTPTQASVKEKEAEPEYIPQPIEQPKKESVFKASKSFLEFPERGGEAQIDVTADAAWRVAETPSWISVVRKNNTLYIKIAANERFSDREGDIVLKTDHAAELRVVIAQARNSDYLSLDAQLIDDTEGDGGKYTIKVNSSKPWKTNVLPSWCIAEVNGENLVIRLLANKSDTVRQTVVEVRMPQSVVPERYLIVKQVPIHNYITINPNIITSTGKSSIATVTVETDMQDYRIEGLPYWCTIKQKSGTSFVVEIADNSGGAAREAQCTVAVEGGKNDKLIIRQEDRLNYVSVSPKIITASKRGGVITVNVKSSGSWRVVNLPDWCQVTEETESTFTLSIDENKTDAPRRASFSVSTGGVRESMEVKQE